MTTAQNGIGPTLTMALMATGYTVERVTDNGGQLRGMRILKDGVPAHQSPFAPADYGWTLLAGTA